MNHLKKNNINTSASVVLGVGSLGSSFRHSHTLFSSWAIDEMATKALQV